MSSVSLNKILLKGEVLSLLRGLITTMTSPIMIQDHKGKVLVSDLGIDKANEQTLEFSSSTSDDSNREQSLKVPVLLEEELLGWVIGTKQVEQVANFLNYIVKREFERKTLAADALDKYREISLLYTISSKMSSCLDVQEIGTLVIEEASRLIRLFQENYFVGYAPSLMR